MHWSLDLGQFKNSALQLRQPDQSAQQVILEILHLCFFNECYNQWYFWPISEINRRVVENFKMILLLLPPLFLVTFRKSKCS